MSSRSFLEFLRIRMTARRRVRGSAFAPASTIALVAALGCGGHGSEKPLTLLASFPDDAIAVCFVQEDGIELGCTTERREAREGTLDYRGTTLQLRSQSPTGYVAVVSGIAPPDVPRDQPLKVRAIAYNEAGASDPSSQFFALDRASKGFPRSREEGVGLASKQIRPAKRTE